MNLMEENPYKENKAQKNKTLLIVVVVLIVILLIAAGIVWVFAQKLAAERLKVYIDGVGKSVASDLFIIQDGEVYTSVKDIADYVGYKEYNGEYKQYTEDTTKCYVTNSKELVTIASGSKTIRKYNLLSDPSGNESQSFNIGEEVIAKGNDLYINQEGLQKTFNLRIGYTTKNNTINIATLPYLVSYYNKQIKTSANSKDAGNFTDSVIFNNEKAILYNFIIVKDSSTSLYGMASLSNPDTLIISARYKQIEFIEGINDFIVTTSDGKVGILGNDAVTKVKPAYDQIKEIDKDEGLYLVTSNQKQGVINQNGKIIVYQDYEQIGLDSTYTGDTNVTNRYLLYGNCIPVESNKKWGLFDKNGNKLLACDYDAIGCSTTNSTDKNTNGIVLIPALNAIVVAKDTTLNNAKVRKYGLVDSSGQAITQLSLDNAYATTVEGTTTYYMTYQSQAIDIVNYILEQRAKQKEQTAGNTTISNTTISNTTINNTTM